MRCGRGEERGRRYLDLRGQFRHRLTTEGPDAVAGPLMDPALSRRSPVNPPVVAEERDLRDDWILAPTVLSVRGRSAVLRVREVEPTARVPLRALVAMGRDSPRILEHPG